MIPIPKNTNEHMNAILIIAGSIPKCSANPLHTPAIMLLDFLSFSDILNLLWIFSLFNEKLRVIIYTIRRWIYLGGGS